MLSFSKYKGKEIFIYSFSSLFYEQHSNNPTCLYSILFFNLRTDIFSIPYFDAPKNMIKYYLVERLYNFQNKNEKLFIPAAYTIIKSLILDASLALNSKINEKTENSRYTTNILTSFNMKIKRN